MEIFLRNTFSVEYYAFIGNWALSSQRSLPEILTEITRWLDSDVTVDSLSRVVICLHCACSYHRVHWSVATGGSVHRGNQDFKWKMSENSYRNLIEVVLIPANHIFGIIFPGNAVTVSNVIEIWSLPDPLCTSICIGRPSNKLNWRSTTQSISN